MPLLLAKAPDTVVLQWVSARPAGLHAIVPVRALEAEFVGDAHQPWPVVVKPLAAQGVVTIEGSPIAGATSIADLKTAKLGAQIGTTSLDAITNVIKPDTAAAVFNTVDEAIAALNGGIIDGIVTDVPAAFYMRDAQLTGGIIVGQLPSEGGAQEQFGIVIEKDSALTACVSAAVDALKADGTLAALLTEWIADKASAPVLK
jgi:polar amino acid transport system substrate-binding protein